MGLDGLAGLLIATLGAAAVGIGRQRSSQVTVNGRRFAGIRTFTLLGTVAGVAGWLIMRGQPMAGALLVVGAVALVAIAYWAVVKQDLDGTTHVAALVVLGAGICAGMHEWQLSSGLYAGTALLLAAKSRLHSVVERMSDEGVRAGIQFGVMALIVLPLLPEGPYGPMGAYVRGNYGCWCWSLRGSALWVTSHARWWERAKATCWPGSWAGWFLPPMSP